MSRIPGYVWWSVLGLLFQAVPWVGFHLIGGAVYSDPPQLSTDSERPLTLGLLAVSWVGSWLLGGLATYSLLRNARLLVALPLLACCCLPALLGGSLYLHGLLVFLTLV